MGCFTTGLANQLIRETGLRTSSMGRVSSITKIQWNNYSPSTTLTSTWLRTTGCAMKVLATLNLGEFRYDDKHGHGRLLLANGEYFEGNFEKDSIHG
jgi:hypothetical protein